MTATPSQFESAVLETVVFFDLFDYPLTSFEIWQNLPRIKISFEQFAATLPENQSLDKQNGFYFLKGREKIVAERQKNYREALQKIKIARRFIKYLRLIPFVKGVALCNSLGYLNARKTDDIDLFVLVEPRKLWLTRGLAVLLAELLATRPSSGKTRNAICLSFFATETADLSSLRLQPQDLSSCQSGREDPYFNWWLTRLLPLYDVGGVWQEFFTRNAWIYGQHPNFFLTRPAPRLIISPPHQNLWCGGEPIPKMLRFILKSIFFWLSTDFMERMARVVQWRLMPVKMKALVNQDTRVVLNNEVLKFHVDDRRELYKQAWEKRLEGLI